MRGAWNTTGEFRYGAGMYMRDITCGIGRSFSSMGQWMYTDFQYEHFNDKFLFQEKSYRSAEGWRGFGRAVREDPLGVMAPGIMEAWRNPLSARAWGKAAVDVGMLGFSAAKATGVLGRAGKTAEQISILGKARNTIDIFKLEQIASEASNAFKKTLVQQAEELVKLNSGKNSVTLVSGKNSHVDS